MDPHHLRVVLEQNSKETVFFNARNHGIRITSKRKLSQLKSKSAPEQDLHSPFISDGSTGKMEDTFLKVERKHGFCLNIFRDGQQLFMMVTDKWLNLLLFAAFPAVLSKILHWSDMFVFCSNFLVMLPLTLILGDLTEVVAAHLGQELGGIMNATFGNAVELIVTVIVILRGQIRLVQTTLLGSIFSCILLVLGCSMFVAGGKIGRKQVKFNPLGANVPAFMLLLSGLFIMMTSIQTYLKVNDKEVAMDVNITSRVGAIILIVIYISYLIFCLRTHREFFNSIDEELNVEEMSLKCGVIGLAVVTILVSIFAHFLVGSIEGVCESTGMTETFLGIIVLPIVENAVEHWTAVVCAYKGKMDIAITISLGSAAQIALFVLPVAVLVGWAANEDVTIGYPLYELALFLFSLQIVSFIVQQGNANWIYGLMLLCIYGFVALTIWYEEVEGD